jgi:hypothetical protein
MPLKIPTGCTQARVDEITTWAYKVWEMHWGVRIRNSAPVSNSRAQFLQYCIRDYKLLDADLMNKIELSVHAFTKHLKLKRKAGVKLIGVKTLSVWYNQSCYEDQFIDESAASLQERAEAREQAAICCTEGCKKPVHGPSYPYCTDHLPNDRINILRGHYKEMRDAGDIDSSKALTPQCKAIFAKHMPNVHKDLENEI